MIVRLYELSVVVWWTDRCWHVRFFSFALGPWNQAASLSGPWEAVAIFVGFKWASFGFDSVDFKMPALAGDSAKGISVMGTSNRESKASP